MTADNTPPTLNLTGKTALITGASRGIGRVIARKFAAAGAKVALHCNQNRAAAEAVRRALPGEGHIVVQANIAHADAVERMVNEVLHTFGELDIAVNNAGVYEEHPLAEVDYAAWLASWQKVIQTNLLGAANVCYCVARHMIERGEGKIINVGSRGAYRGEPLAPAYGASKAGLHALSQSLAKYLGPYNIYVTAIAPGFVQTEMVREHLTGEQGEAIRRQSPLNRVATPEEVAHAVLFLAAPGSEWLTGAVIDINGASYLR